MWVYLRWENWATQWPAPDGFHVPLTSERAAIVSAWVSDGAWGSNGWSNMKAYLKLPYCWTRSYLNWNVDWYQDRKWTYWSSSQRDSARWYCLFFQDSQILSQNSDQTISWCSVRPFYNKSVTPDSSWTALYSDKIYHNSSLWLISVKNWSSWITIADKNVWATTVYNSWDTLSESNCWKFFQRWNNYWFPYTWSVTTSGTQVNAGTYWPNNYYSSSTFITRNSNPYSWDSSNNANLWWWVDGNVLVQKELKNAYIWEWVDVTSLTLDKSSISLTNVWDTEQITATTVPAWATVTWSSSNTTVATVSSSWLVTCVSPWSCTITAESFGVTATCSVSQWWTPTANTIAYYPFKSDLLDYSGNHNDWTSWTWTFANNMVTTTSNLVGNPLVTNVSMNFTLTAWIDWDKTTQTAWYVVVTPYWNSWWPTLCIWVNFSNGWVMWAMTNTWVVPVTQTLSWIHCFHFTRDWSTFKWYIDWVLQWTTTNSISLGSGELSMIWWIGSFYSVTCWNVIFEDKAWTQQEITDYFNLTKWDYWIS